MKTCARCKVAKSVDQFFTIKKRGKVVLNGACKRCVSEQQKESYQRHKDSRLARNRKRYAANRDRYNAASRSWSNNNKPKIKEYIEKNKLKIAEQNWKQRIQRNYKISSDTYSQMLQDQQGGCAICQTDKPWSRSNKFAVDHDHSTGRIRGLLCHPCNKALGLFKDSPDIMKSAAHYLESQRCT